MHRSANERKSELGWLGLADGGSLSGGLVAEGGVLQEGRMDRHKIHNNILA